MTKPAVPTRRVLTTVKTEIHDLLLVLSEDSFAKVEAKSVDLKTGLTAFDFSAGQFTHGVDGDLENDKRFTLLHKLEIEADGDGFCHDHIIRTPTAVLHMRVGYSAAEADADYNGSILEPVLVSFGPDAESYFLAKSANDCVQRSVKALASSIEYVRDKVPASALQLPYELHMDLALALRSLGLSVEPEAAA